MIPPGNTPNRASTERVEKVKAVLNRSRQYWPLTPKQAYYQMVQRGQVGRGLNDYAEFTAFLWTSLREGRLPVKSVWYPAQEIHDGGAWENRDEFVRAELEDLLWGYRRDLLQGQPRYVEVWLEKPELADFFGDITVDYCISTAVCSAAPSLRFLGELRRRLENLNPGRTGVPGQRPEVVVLYFGDYNPLNPDDLNELQESLRSEGGFWEITLKRVELTRKTVARKTLPARVHFGERDEALHPGAPTVDTEVVELEALSPRSLAAALKKAIESELDMELLENQKEIQSKELAVLKRLRVNILRHIDHLLSG